MFLSKNCFYCNDNVKIGIDRVDSSKGYTIDNVVPCCSKCNWMKGVLSKEDFINQCKKISLFC